MSETVYLMGEGGGVFEMTLPLDRHIARRYAEGELLRVNPDGSEYEAPEEVPEDDDRTEPTAPKVPSKAAAAGA